MKTTKRLLSIALVLVTIALTAITGFAAYENTWTNTGNQRADIVGVAKTQLGYTEGSNNNNKYGAYFNNNYAPWCAYFVSWCARQADIPESILQSSACAGTSSKYFNIPYSNGSSYTPKQGDLFFTKSWSHVGLVWYVDGAYFYTIEGNSNSNGSNEGYAVVSNKRRISNFYFGTPDYQDNSWRDTYNDVFAAKIGQGYSVDQARSAEQTTFQKGDYVYVWGWLHDIDDNLYKSYSCDVCNMTLSIYRPNGSLAYTYTYEDSDNNWIGTKLNVSGTWKIRCQIGGALIGDNERAIKVQTKSAPHYELDLNGSIDGTKYWSLEDFATADVYIDGKLVANDCNDFYKSYPKGTKFKITDIRGKNGYTYSGAKTISGTLNGNRDTTLKFKTGWPTNFRMKSGAYTNAYDGVNGSKVGRVYPGDVVTVKYIYNNGWMKLSCPWDGGNNKIVYVKATEFKFRATKYIYAYSGVNGDYVGRVYPDDLVTVKKLYSSGWMKCVCPWDGGTNKTIFVKVSEIY